MVAQEEWSASRLAAEAVVLHHKGSTAEKRELLDMLGLLDDTGTQITPDDTRFYEMATSLNGGGPAPGMSTTTRMAHLFEPPLRPEEFTSPPALRNYAERATLADIEAAKAARAAAPTKAPRAPRPIPLGGIRLGYSSNGRPVAVCPSLGGRRKHVRLGEPICDGCRLVYNAWQRERNHRKQGNNWEPKRKPAECGTPSGRKRHYREKTKVCEPCLAAAREDGKKNYHAAQTRRRALREQTLADFARSEMVS